ncbi:MAG: ATP synthase subunit C [Spirochaetaceae bacterium]
METHVQQFRRRVAGSILILAALIVMLGAVSAVQVYAQEPAEEAQPMTETEASVAKFGFIAAAVAFGFGALGAGIGIANVGAAAMGAISEKPEVAGQALIFVALAEGLVVFGFITALIILGRV